MRKTYTAIEFHGKNDFIVSNCFSIAFYRPTGTNPVYVNGMPIGDGQTMTLNQNVNHMDTSKYEIVFTAGAGDNELYTIRILPHDGEI